MLGQEVIISKENSRWLFTKDRLASKIEEKDLLRSIRSTDNKEETTRIYTSLYQAIEYANYCHQKLDRFNRHENLEANSIWAIYYQGNASLLDFKTEYLVLNETVTSTSYNHSQRKLASSFAEVPRDAVLPLVGTVIFCIHDFSDCQVFNKVFYKHSDDLTDDPIQVYKSQV